MDRFKADWDRPEMRDALARRDIGTVFRLLVEGGVPQRELALTTRQNQSEISEIIGGRQVMAYELLERISLTLGIPRGYLGLGYEPIDDAPSPDEAAKRASFLAHAAETVNGQPVFGSAERTPQVEEATPVPSKVGAGDVEILQPRAARPDRVGVAVRRWSRAGRGRGATAVGTWPAQGRDA